MHRAACLSSGRRNIYSSACVGRFASRSFSLSWAHPWKFVPIQHSLAAALDQALLSHSKSFSHASRICCGTTFEGAVYSRRLLLHDRALQAAREREREAQIRRVRPQTKRVQHNTRRSLLIVAPTLDPRDDNFSHRWWRVLTSINFNSICAWIADWISAKD